MKEARKRDENATNTTRGISCKVLEGVGGVLLTTQAISKTSKSKRIGVEEVDGE